MGSDRRHGLGSLTSGIAGSGVTDQRRDDLLHEMNARLKQMDAKMDDVKDIVVVVARSHRALLAKLESPIVDEIREDLEQRLEQAGVAIA